MNNPADFGEDSFCPDDPEGSGNFDTPRASDLVPSQWNGSRAGTQGQAEVERPAFEVWSFLEVLRQRWRWLAIGGGAMAAFGLLVGLTFWKTKFTATAQLVRHDSPAVTEVCGDRQMSQQTFASLLRSPELLQRVGAQVIPPLSPKAMASRLRITPERDSETILLAVSGRSLPKAVELANLYAREAVGFGQDRQAAVAAEVNRFVTEQLAHIETELTAVTQRTRSVPLSSPLVLPTAAAAAPGRGAALSPVSMSFAEKLQSARAELVDLLAEYTEAHPRVQAQRAKLAALEGQVGTNAGAAQPHNSGSLLTATVRALDANEQPAPEVIASQLQAIETSRIGLLTRQRAAQTLQANPPGYYQVLAPATVNDVLKHGTSLKIAFLTLFAGLIGVIGAAFVALLNEVLDERLKTSTDVRRVTGLPVLAEAGDLKTMSEAERRNWAFRAWTNLQGRLSHSPNHGVICGITSAGPGEGRSTWVKLLAEAAAQRGFRVLTIATHSSSHNNGHMPELSPKSPNGDNRERTNADAPRGTDVLASPASVTRMLTGPDSQPCVHLPLPGWVWNLDRRRQWQTALQQWSQIGNLVILAELPPSSMPEAVLLAENLPNLIWLCDSGKATAAPTREQVETLRHAHCRLAGAVINHAQRSPLKERLPRWVASVALIGALGACGFQTRAQEPATAARTNQAANTNLSFSALTPANRAAWQEKLTLGPGDVLNVSLFGQPELTRSEMSIGPDGRINYLEAQDIIAAGLTIDELRNRLDQELARYRRAPRTIITPSAFRSKKFFILGRVGQAGVYTLDRPMTIIEAVAHARGLETTLADRNTVELADFSRSFLARGGRRLQVDLERLFQHGDLSQNVALEPDDYLFFPAGEIQELYVLGEVRVPGPIAYRPEMGAVGAIALRGGFTERAWRRKILVVRGSLNKPQPVVVNAAAIVAAREADFKLRPKDIVYVSARPWIKAEELLDAVASSFVEAAIITATGKLFN